MQHCGTVLIETDRLILRRLRLDDSVAVFQNWTSDCEVTKFLTWTTHQSVDDTKNLLDKWVTSYDNDNYYQWAIVLKNSCNEPIGDISVVEQNEKLNAMSVGYRIGRKWWNKGIMSEAFAAIITFLFETVKVNRIGSWHDLNNPNSGKVMLKCGLKYEGTIGQCDSNNQGIVDATVYSILASDYAK